jgi:hypothetical protein
VAAATETGGSRDRASAYKPPAHVYCSSLAQLGRKPDQKIIIGTAEDFVFRGAAALAI